VSAFDNAGKIPPQQIWDGVVSRSVKGVELTLALIELEPNANVPEHSHSNEQVGFLIEGSMRFTVGGETAEIAPGGSWTILADVPHSVLAGPDGAVLVEAFSPPRHDWAAIPAAEPGPGRWP
jgi:quercetin dioxygenase-like cupin family protein